MRAFWVKRKGSSAVEKSGSGQTGTHRELLDPKCGRIHLRELDERTRHGHDPKHARTHARTHYVHTRAHTLRRREGPLEKEGARSNPGGLALLQCVRQGRSAISSQTWAAPDVGSMREPYGTRGGNKKPCVFPRSRLRFTPKAGSKVGAVEA